MLATIGFTENLAAVPRRLIFDSLVDYYALSLKGGSHKAGEISHSRAAVAGPLTASYVHVSGTVFT